MLQVTQYQKTGKMLVEKVPAPMLCQGGVLVQNAFSLVSAGTERTSVETAQASLIGKAQKRPDLVKQVRENIRREGVLATWEKVQNRLDNYAQLGYSSAGVVIESSVNEFQPGDRVACAGAGYASHAEIVFVPKNLVARVPDNVTLQQGAYTTLAAIAMQGVRQADVRLGETVAVIGLGLLGLISVQVLKAAGCRVVGLDIDETNFALAQRLGCDLCLPSTSDSLTAIQAFSRGYGMDAVVITAATKSNQPVELAIEMARKKGTVVIVGAVGMNIPRNPFYQKELDFRISCSYGPGRYDADYEERGIDYPLGYVRWTENRNMQAVLDLISSGALDVDALTTHIFPIDQALKAYDLITDKTKEVYRGILISYPQVVARTTEIILQKPAAAAETLHIGFIGAGNFAQSYLLPHVKKQKVQLSGIMTSTPLKAKSVARKFDFAFCTSDAGKVIENSDVVFIASRHDSHAHYVVQALAAGKHVFVEKPLAINREELDSIAKAALAARDQILFVGFNRRFSPPFRRIKEFFADVQEPFVMTYRVNAGFIPRDHWTQAPDQGGRIIGEACHFIDAMSYLCGAVPVSVFAQSIRGNNTEATDSDNVSIVLRFSDGSIGTLIYVANGDRSLDKEYFEMSAGNQTAIMDNFRRARFFKNSKMKKETFDGGKGHKQEIAAFLETIRDEDNGIPLESLYLTTLATFGAMDSIKTGQAQDLIFNPDKIKSATIEST